LKLSFPSLIVHDFGSFVGKHVFNFEAYGPGLHFVRGLNKVEPRLGSNGSGKSTVFNALCWCLTGKAVDGRRGPDIEPRYSDRHPFVAVGVKTDDDLFILTRATHPNALKLGEDVVGQDTVDGLTRLPFGVLTHTALLGQGQPLFYDLEPKRKMELLGEVLNLDRWDTRSEAASKKTAELQREESALSAEIRAAEDHEDRLTSMLERAKTQWKEWRDEAERREKEAAETLKRYKEERETLEREAAGYSLAYDSAQTELQASQASSRRLATEIETALAKKSKDDAAVTIQKNKIKDFETEIELFDEAENCPTCGQSLEGTSLNKRIKEIRAEIRTAQGQLKTRTSTAEYSASAIEILKTRLTNNRRAEIEFSKKVNDNRNALDRINPKIAGATASIGQLETVSREKKENPYTKQVEELRRDLKDNELKLERKSGAITKLAAQIERTKFWIRGFKDVRLYLIEEVLQELELTTNAALSDVGLIDWEVSYAIERETKSGTIQRGLTVSIQGPKDKEAVRWECWSGGEGQRLRLIGALALSEVLLARAGVEPDMEILDEPTAHLSKEGVRDLCEYLADRAEQLGRATFLIDHMAVESSRFASVTTIIKTAKGSEIVT
jgi:DNA repair exonuclease SbcCD ATPase subunit